MQGLLQIIGKRPCDYSDSCDSELKETWLDGHGNASCAIPDEVVYTVAEVAGLLRVHKSTVYRDIESGRIDAYRVGKGRGTVRIKESALLEYQRRAARHPDGAGA